MDDRGSNGDTSIGIPFLANANRASLNVPEMVCINPDADDVLAWALGFPPDSTIMTPDIISTGTLNVSDASMMIDSKGTRFACKPDATFLATILSVAAAVSSSSVNGR